MKPKGISCLYWSPIHNLTTHVNIPKTSDTSITPSPKHFRQQLLNLYHKNNMAICFCSITT